MEKKKPIWTNIKKIISLFTIVISLILALGYPTGGVKVNSSNYVLQSSIKRAIINRTLNKKQNLKEPENKKKKIFKKFIPPPTMGNNSQDEGC